MIAQATVHAYNESKRITGWFTMIDENLAVPSCTENGATAATPGTMCRRTARTCSAPR
jgi:hypothetical protein